MTGRWAYYIFCVYVFLHSRQIDRMKKIYFVSSGDHYLTSEVLFKLNLLDSDQWHTRNLRHIQSEVLKPLLLYW